MLEAETEATIADDAQNCLHDLVDAINRCVRLVPVTDIDLQVEWAGLLNAGMAFGSDWMPLRAEPAFEATFFDAGYFDALGRGKLKPLDDPYWSEIIDHFQYLFPVKRPPSWIGTLHRLPADIVDLLSRMPENAAGFDRGPANLWAIVLAITAKRAWRRKCPSQSEHMRNSALAPFRGAGIPVERAFEELFRALVAQLPPEGAAWDERFLVAWLSLMHQSVMLAVDAESTGTRR